MSFIMKYKKSFIVVLPIIAVLVFAFFFDGENNTVEDNPAQIEVAPQIVAEEMTKIDIEEQNAQADEPKTKQEEPSQDIKPETVYETETVPEADDTAEQIEENELSCTLSVRCDVVVGRCGKKNGIIPADGVIFAERKVKFVDGESIFDVLLREMTENNIHLEFVKTPIYNSMYIEGIGNLYEFDCGATSGWKYKVNGQFLNVGCSQYILKDGDRVEWVYVCSVDNSEKEDKAEKELENE